MGRGGAGGEREERRKLVNNAQAAQSRLLPHDSHPSLRNVFVVQPECISRRRRRRDGLWFIRTRLSSSPSSFVSFNFPRSCSSGGREHKFPVLHIIWTRGCGRQSGKAALVLVPFPATRVQRLLQESVCGKREFLCLVSAEREEVMCSLLASRVHGNQSPSRISNSLIDVPVLPVCHAPCILLLRARENHFNSVASIERKFFLVFAIWFGGATAVTNESPLVRNCLPQRQSVLSVQRISDCAIEWSDCDLFNVFYTRKR